MNRRTLLAALPASGAMLILSSSAPAVAAEPISTASAPPAPARKSADALLSLPFVRNTSRAEQRAGLPPRLFWSVKPSGDYGRDCDTGSAYAIQALDYMAEHRMPHLMQWAVLDMIRHVQERTGIEVGFLSVFGNYGMATRMIINGNLPKVA
ncbi:hypothetical protein GVY41_09075 [Frigidibacter albus]|uniref:Uncharacterized protein n=1 Tax=Frigidibacter albus TaxID=1465486 RepID=A0A6L8VGF2_9RHOB|nr:hypothetical protein [Frigidibacter albus]MZQ89244.1 hypothetical protein [Frigidibacter albus]NBE31150.1 hypothetical protein [Frigidibacter albus]GGH53142.1 hypothetical protein GCM10011341_18330 [Frigidibacter albus]